MINEFSRTELLLGREGVERLKNSSVAVFGIGGVGSYIAEALARCGVGKLTLVDSDTVSITNINRQIIALHSTVGMKKTDAAKRRIADINPSAEIAAIDCFYTGSEIDLSGFDYIADAIDTVSSKLALIENAYKLGIPIISSMGTGNKLDPSKLTVTDIYKTEMCPLAKVMRHELKKRNVKKLKAVYSTEKPRTHLAESEEHTEKRRTIGSVSFVPSCAGLIMAGEIVRDICGTEINFIF
ncbi:MAG: tRNA threonylcarbamoyladenosine dehydratase [Clostridium sp.]|nr:tRNA threonylcarbamoyladenosine dehydratase [Clostridium sp.]MCM1547841.1 tRNA threonylcarbamoyladenosine dehydratase [Ruminococcus sp.]